MTTRPKTLAAVDVAVAHGISRADAAPPLHRLLWRLGVDVRPPHFERFGRNAWTLGLTWGILMAVFSACYALTIHPEGGVAVVGKAVCVAFLAAILFGLAMAAVFRARARKAKLPAWDDVGTAAR